MITQQNDKYTWCAVYDDGNHLEEQNAEHGFSSVDQGHIQRLMLLCTDGEAIHSVTVPTNAQAVFFRRRSIALGLADESSTPQSTAHCIGWKRGDDAIYLFVGPGGDTLLTTDLQAV